MRGPEGVRQWVRVDAETSAAVEVRRMGAGVGGREEEGWRLTEVGEEQDGRRETGASEAGTQTRQWPHVPKGDQDGRTGPGFCLGRGRSKSSKGGL